MDDKLACCGMGYRLCVCTKDQWFRFLRGFGCKRWIIKEERWRKDDGDGKISWNTWKKERLPVLYTSGETGLFWGSMLFIRLASSGWLKRKI